MVPDSQDRKGLNWSWANPPHDSWALGNQFRLGTYIFELQYCLKQDMSFKMSLCDFLLKKKQKNKKTKTKQKKHTKKRADWSKLWTSRKL